jgi:hypothetical protein
MDAVRKAQRNILRIKISARAKTGVPPYSDMRAGPRHPKMTLPYNSVDTANACTNCTLTRLLNNPSNLV